MALTPHNSPTHQFQIANPKIKGFVTQSMYLNGKTLQQLEKLLGFHSGRLAAGAAVLVPLSFPDITQFETMGYNQVAGHRHVFPSGLDSKKIKENARASWQTGGAKGLVRLNAFTGHDLSMKDDDQYPPGPGIPQWKILTAVPAKVVAVLQNYQDVLRIY